MTPEQKYPESGKVVRVAPIRQQDGNVAKRYGGARILTFEDGRQIVFSEGALPYNGAGPAHHLVGRVIRWSTLRGIPLSSVFECRSMGDGEGDV